MQNQMGLQIIYQENAIKRIAIVQKFIEEEEEEWNSFVEIITKRIIVNVMQIAKEMAFNMKEGVEKWINVNVLKNINLCVDLISKLMKTYVSLNVQTVW